MRQSGPNTTFKPIFLHAQGRGIGGNHRREIFILKTAFTQRAAADISFHEPAAIEIETGIRFGCKDGEIAVGKPRHQIRPADVVEVFCRVGAAKPEAKREIRGVGKRRPLERPIGPFPCAERRCGCQTHQER
jgi:hypothetical protein